METLITLLLEDNFQESCVGLPYGQYSVWCTQFSKLCTLAKLLISLHQTSSLNAEVSISTNINSRMLTTDPF